MLGWTTWPHYFEVCFFFIYWRKFPTRAEIKRFLHSGASGFNADCLWKVCVKWSTKSLWMFSSFWLHKSTLDQFTLGLKASNIAPTKPWISASSWGTSWSFAGDPGRISGHLLPQWGGSSPQGHGLSDNYCIIFYNPRTPLSSQSRSLWIGLWMVTNLSNSSLNLVGSSESTGKRAL